MCKLAKSERAVTPSIPLPALWDGLPDCVLLGGTKLVGVISASGSQQQS